MFKIRYSDGKVGTDNTPTRFPYLATFGNYTRRTGAGEQEVYYNWGDLNSGFGYPGLTYTRVSSNNVTWEIARKHDLGFDLYLWGDKFGLTVDYFDEKREGIYMTRSYLPDMVGIQEKTLQQMSEVSRRKGSMATSSLIKGREMSVCRYEATLRTAKTKLPKPMKW